MASGRTASVFALAIAGSSLDLASAAHAWIGVLAPQF